MHVLFVFVEKRLISLFFIYSGKLEQMHKWELFLCDMQRVYNNVCHVFLIKPE